MATESSTPPETVTAKVSLTVAGSRLNADITVPTAPTPLLDICPSSSRWRTP